MTLFSALGLDRSSDAENSRALVESVNRAIRNLPGIKKTDEEERERIQRYLREVREAVTASSAASEM